MTGAAGSIGSEACRQIAAHAPAVLVLADIDENNLYFLFRNLRHLHPDLRVEAQVVDIRDAARVEQLLREYRPQDVVHAAAHKHVPLMEYAPEEAVKNNVIGCLNVVDGGRPAGRRALRARLHRQGGQPRERHGSHEEGRRAAVLRTRRRARSTRFSTVRFGNVLGSAGSVVPLFKEQIARGGPVTVTHPDCRRYLMTIPEAVGLVLLAGLGGYGELLILEMGEPIRILDLARMMISLSGHVPDKDIPIVITGLRPGREARRGADDRGGGGREPGGPPQGSGGPEPAAARRPAGADRPARDPGPCRRPRRRPRGVARGGSELHARAARGRGHSQRIALTATPQLASVGRRRAGTCARRSAAALPSHRGRIASPPFRAGGRRPGRRHGPRSATTPRRARARGRDART